MIERESLFCLCWFHYILVQHCVVCNGELVDELSKWRVQRHQRCSMHWTEKCLPSLMKFKGWLSFDKQVFPSMCCTLVLLSLFKNFLHSRLGINWFFVVLFLGGGFFFVLFLFYFFSMKLQLVFLYQTGQLVYFLLSTRGRLLL